MAGVECGDERAIWPEEGKEKRVANACFSRGLDNMRRMLLNLNTGLFECEELAD